MKCISKAAVIILSLYFSSCAAFFQGKIPMDTISDESSLKELLTPSAKIKKLKAPAQVFASQALFAGTIMVNWQTVENATSYRIERAVTVKDSSGNFPIPDESEFKTLRKSYYKTTYSDKILTNPLSDNEEYNYRYYYRIMAENITDGLESSDYTDYKNGKTQAIGWLFSAPSSVEAAKGKSTDSIKVTWKTSPDASFYNIYRSTRADFSTQVLMGTVRGNQGFYSDPITSADQGMDFYYKIEGLNSSRNASAKSSIAMGYALKEGAPKAPDGLQVVNGLGTSTTQISIKWEKVDDTALATMSYSVYRTSSIDSVYSCIAKDLTTENFIDNKNLKIGVIYYYYVQTTSTNISTQEKLKSPFTETGHSSPAPARGFLLSPPLSLEAADAEENPDENINLIWDKAIGSEIEGITYKYNIYSSVTEDGTYSIISGFAGISGQPYGSDRLFARVPKKDFYRISTVNESGTDTESIHSRTAAPMPDAPQNVEASKTERLDDSIWQPNDYEVYPVKITWTAPEKEPKPAAYHVYRSTKPDAAFKRLTETPITETSYIDTNETAKAGIIYYYKIYSLNTLNQGKKSNDPVSDLAKKSAGYGALTRNQWFREYNKTIASSQKKLTLMHKPSDTGKLGSETINGKFKGTLGYTASIAGLGARITMPYTDYADYAINDDANFDLNNDGTPDYYFLLNGTTNTSADMSGNGSMDGTVNCIGMYPGSVKYDALQIRGGAAGGGYYVITTKDIKGNTVFEDGNVDWLIGEEK